MLGATFSAVMTILGGMIACSPEAEEGGLETRTLRQHLVAEEVVSLAFTLPQSSAVQDLVVASKETVQPRDRLKIAGSVVSTNGDVSVGNDAQLGSIVSGGKVTVGHRSKVTGAVVAKTTATIAPTATVGSVSQGQPVPFRTVSWSVKRPASARVAVALEPDQKRHLEPGSYGNLTVKSRARLFLTSGEYFFDRVQIEPQAVLVVEMVDAPVEMYVKQGFTFRGAVQGVGGIAPQLFVGYTGSEAMFIERSFQGAIVAPLAEVKFQAAQPSGHDVAVFGKRVTLEPDTIIRPYDFDWGPVVGGKEVPDMPEGTPEYEMPRSPADIRVSHEGTEHDNLTANTSTNQPVHFTLPGKYSVSGGTLANGSVTFSFGMGGTQVTCSYVGGSSSATPTTAAELNAGRTAHFQGCSDGLAHDVVRQADTFSLTLNPVAHHPVKIVSPAQVEDTCSDQLEILSAADTYAMAHSFDWDDAEKVAATDEDGNHALYYAWVYIRDQKELLALKQLYLHVLDTPLFAEEWHNYQGKCGTFVNQSDGEGEFVSVVIPGATYNKLIDALNSDEVMNGGVVFDAVILREVPSVARTAQGSIKWDALAQAGFKYLGYEADPFRDPDDIQLDSGVSKALFEPLAWVARAVKNTVQAMTDLLGALDEATQGQTTVIMHMHSVTEDPVFAIPRDDVENPYDYQIMRRGWGDYANKPLGAPGMEVRVQQWLFGAPIPATQSGKTNRNGRVRIKLADEEGTSKAICMELRSRGAQVTKFLVPKTLCDLREWDADGVDDAEIKINTSRDGEYQFKIHDTSLMGLYQADDVYQYARDVMDHVPKRARILTGYWAETFTTKTSEDKDRLYAPCLNLSNSLSDSSVHIIGLGTALAAPLFPALGALVDLAPGATPPSAEASVPVQGAGVFAGVTVSAVVASGLIQTFANVIMNTDIVMSEHSKLPTHRAVMSHEYGHYLLCSLLHDVNDKAVGYLAWSTIHHRDNLSVPARFLHEAAADYFMGQVAGGLDYGWLRVRRNAAGETRPSEGDRPQLPSPFGKTPEQIDQDLLDYQNALAVYELAVEQWDDQDDREPDQFCVDPIEPSPIGDDCWEQHNYLQSDDSDSSLNIGRIATLLMDVFDGQGAPRGSLVPNDGDSWNYSATGPDAEHGHLEGKLPLVYSSYGYLNRDSHLERVALDASAWSSIASHLAEGLRTYGQADGEIDDVKIYGSLYKAMEAEGETWCDACRVLALHAPQRKGLEIRQLLETCVEDPLLVEAMDSPPIPVGTINANTCLACPAGQGTLMDGTCGVCSVDVVIDASGLTADSQTFDTMTTAAGDTCPEVFVLDVRNLSSLPAGLMSLGAGVEPAFAACEQLYTFNYEQLDASGTVMSSQTLSGTGSRPPCETDLCLEGCNGLPLVFEDALPLPFASMRFHVPGQAGLDFYLSAGEEDDEILR